MDGISVNGHLIPEEEIEERFDTPGGPGGQHSNRNETAVTLRYDIESGSLPDEIKARLIRSIGPVVEARSADSRSQWRNRAAARRRLAHRLREGMVEPAPRKPTKPSRAAKERRLRSKRARSELKRRRRPPEVD